ncbi:M67 family metallopeptidase [Novosphingobium sp. YJ-S2-02]|uniref:M67 family metallopeptidase n=1 Tax=Novosphingobium aureum TaxID=2792964 RepID=A0A931HAM9_9SPHN|nr:M67 family metallopeptidase [Novosphingobium aureum]MBH0112482.1 M67 family metallopeptidase [Novosphingobium aureum]
MEVEVTRAVLDSLREEARKAHPEECCGLLLGGREGLIDRFRAAANLAKVPERFFEIDPAVLLAAHREAREGGVQVQGYYHSHPQGLARPSTTDQEHSTGDLRIWAIIARDDVAFWRDRGNGFDEVACRVV